eukprot:COSAG02_NODE_2277_length_9240_cov_4.345914_2_plen_345_part_00
MSRLCIRVGICEVLAQFGTSLSMAHISPSQRSATAYTPTSSSSMAASKLTLKSISEMTVGPLADGRVMRTPQDVVRLLIWLLQKDLIVPVFEHFYLSIPTSPVAAKDGMPAWTEEEASPRTPKTPRLSWESGSSSGSGSTIKTENEGQSAEAPLPGAASDPKRMLDSANSSLRSDSAASVGVASTRGLDGSAASTVSAQASRGSDRPTSIKLELPLPTAHAAGLSTEELTVLQSLQTPVRENWRQDGGANTVPPPTEEELRVFLRWCPLLRGGCRSADLMKVTGSIDGETPVSADWSRSNGGGDSSSVNGATIYQKRFVQHVLEKFSSCLVKIVHEEHPQPDRG